MLIFTACKRSLRRLCFYTCLSFILFAGGLPDQVHPPGTRYTPLWSRHTPPRTRYTPQDQAPPPEQTPPRADTPLGPGTPPSGADTPPRPGTPPRTRHPPTRHPPEQTPPWSRYPPGTRYTPQSRHPSEQTPPWSRHPPGTRYTPQSRPPQDQVHPPGSEHAGRYGQRAGGPHPTGMQSCFPENHTTNTNNNTLKPLLIFVITQASCGPFLYRRKASFSELISYNV